MTPDITVDAPTPEAVERALRKLVKAVDKWATTIHGGKFGSRQADRSAQTQLDMLDARDEARAILAALRG